MESKIKELVDELIMLVPKSGDKKEKFKAKRRRKRLAISLKVRKNCYTSNRI